MIKKTCEIIICLFINISLSVKDPLTDPIEPGQTTIEIIKEKMGLGLSIVGGSDTLLVSKNLGFFY